jgi:hypothetical protein
MKRALLLSLLAACAVAPAFAKKDVPAPVCPEPIKPSLFLSPMGEPFRPKGEGDDPVKRWFDQADRNQDGKLTVGELMLDGDRFFATLDKDGNGELLPDEVAAYEENIAPEIRLYQRRPSRDDAAAAGAGADGKKPGGDDGDKPRKPPKRGKMVDDGIVGGGRYGLLNIPNPVASADRDFNRAISQQEFRAAAVDRFNDLDPKQEKSLSFAQLPKTPAQQAANLLCLQRIKERKDQRR